MLQNSTINSHGAKVVTYRSSMPASVTVRQWVIYHLLAARSNRSKAGPSLRPPEYRDLLQLKLSDAGEAT